MRMMGKSGTLISDGAVYFVNIQAGCFVQGEAIPCKNPVTDEDRDPVIRSTWYANQPAPKVITNLTCHSKMLSRMLMLRLRLA